MPAISVSPYLQPILLLILSNVFMTLAWYGHLRFKQVPLASVVLVSWGSRSSSIASRCRLTAGAAVYTAAQLKTIREVITLVVFAGFSIVYLKETFTWNYAVGFALIAAGAFFVFRSA